ncbi:DUF6153 family protein [Streptomyces aquilus]|uniref:Uncharacterized protein n=1 Tax=Streptomyces aquilus TaxID=2548456 RepID=A0A3Q9C8J9_9ACTN|nr:DUF6153 family protein [Streptomyces aquilus]AZP22186.1 hypothetical protein EJC51_42555 [Streptomyces aquilus]
MTVRGASTPRNRARQGVGRVVCAAVVAVLAALAVLVHHELSAPSTGPASASARHVMTPGTTMPTDDNTAVAGQVAAAVVPSAGEVDRAGCSETAMQHCSAAGVEVVKLRAPVRTPVLWSPSAPEAVATGPEAAGTVERAPPDLSVLSQLRI